MSPRTTAAATNAGEHLADESGATSRSTMVPCIFMNIDDAVLRNAFVMTPSVTRPGTMKRTYGTPSTSRSRAPSAKPNTRK